MPVVPLLARISNPFAWRSPERNARRLIHFARAELNTLVELEQAANATPSAERAAAYLRHAADEARHARMFVGHARRLATEHGFASPGMPTTDTTHLYDTLGEERFVAFMHYGEGRGKQQFEAYRDHLTGSDAQGSAMFGAILADEAQHESYSGALMMELSPAPASALRRVRLWELWRTLRTVQRTTARWLFDLGLLLLFPVLAAVSVWTRFTRPERVGWSEGEWPPSSG